MMKRTPMPPRTAPMKRTPVRLCGPSPGSAVSAWPATGLPGPWRPTGFSARVKLLVRVRAGQGNADEAVCEACGHWLGERAADHGQVQHRHARKAGGSRDPVTDGIANAALLCGSSLDLRSCHGKCEHRDPLMRERGWWIKTGNGPEFDPRYVCVVLWSGAEQWLGTDGKYHDKPPGTVAA